MLRGVGTPSSKIDYQQLKGDKKEELQAEVKMTLDYALLKAELKTEADVSAVYEKISDALTAATKLVLGAECRGERKQGPNSVLQDLIHKRTVAYHRAKLQPGRRRKGQLAVANKAIKLELVRRDNDACAAVAEKLFFSTINMPQGIFQISQL